MDKEHITPKIPMQEAPKQFDADQMINDLRAGMIGTIESVAAAKKSVQQLLTLLKRQNEQSEEGSH